MACITENSRLERIITNSNLEITWSIRQQNPPSETEQRHLNEETIGVWARLREAVSVVKHSEAGNSGKSSPTGPRELGEGSSVTKSHWTVGLNRMAPSRVCVQGSRGAANDRDALWRQGRYWKEEGECPPRWSPMGHSLARILKAFPQVLQGYQTGQRRTVNGWEWWQEWQGKIISTYSISRMKSASTWRVARQLKECIDHKGSNDY